MRFDRLQEVEHVVALVHDVVRQEQAAGCHPGKDHVEELDVVRFPRIQEHHVEVACTFGISLKASPATTVTMSERPAFWTFAAASFARTGSYSMVVNFPPV